jgi:hypothetical protein
MNGFTNVRAVLRGFTLVGLIAGTASTAAASFAPFVYCDGFNGNNSTSIAGAGCETPMQIDCWEDPTHNPPQWAAGKTYARAQLRVCNGTQQLRAYAFGNLAAKTTELGGDSYFAYAEALDLFGTVKLAVRDVKADSSYSAWTTVPSGTATTVRSTGWIWHT